MAIPKFKKVTAKENYEQASRFDRLGKEEKARIFYEAALTEFETLSKKDQQGLFLGLGSTYRWLKHFEDSVRILQNGAKRFPKNPEFKVFLALTLLEMGKSEEAVSLVIDVLLSETKKKSLLQYERSLRQQIRALSS